MQVSEETTCDGRGQVMMAAIKLVQVGGDGMQNPGHFPPHPSLISFSDFSSTLFFF